jgi:hypothetical protein
LVDHFRTPFICISVDPDLALPTTRHANGMALQNAGFGQSHLNISN